MQTMQTRADELRELTLKAKQDLEDSTKLFEKEVEPLQAKVRALEAIIDRKREDIVDPKKVAYNRINDEYVRANREEKQADALDLLYGEPSLERMARLAKYLRRFWGTPRVREIRNEKRPYIKTYGFTEQGADRAWYLAFSGGCLISALSVDKSRHPGDTTYTTAYGVEELKKHGGSWSRSGYSMREWMDPEYVKYRGLTPVEKTTLQDELIRVYG